MAMAAAGQRYLHAGTPALRVLSALYKAGTCAIIMMLEFVESIGLARSCLHACQCMHVMV